LTRATATGAATSDWLTIATITITRTTRLSSPWRKRIAAWNF